MDLGGAKELTKRRRGEKLFHSANVTFRRQFSCSSCHPDGHIDNIVYDIEDDGIGMGPIDNRTLRGVNDMAPYKWTGINPSLRRQCGPRLAVFITRIQPFTPEQLDDLHYYLCTIPRPPNRYRKLGEDLTEAQRRGKAMFERAPQERRLAHPARATAATPAIRRRSTPTARSTTSAPSSPTTATASSTRRTCSTSTTPRPTCTTASPRRSRRSGPSTTPTTNTA